MFLQKKLEFDKCLVCMATIADSKHAPGPVSKNATVSVLRYVVNACPHYSDHTLADPKTSWHSSLLSKPNNVDHGFRRFALGLVSTKVLGYPWLRAPYHSPTKLLCGLEHGPSNDGKLNFGAEERVAQYLHMTIALSITASSRSSILQYL